MNKEKTPEQYVPPTQLEKQQKQTLSFKTLDKSAFRPSRCCPAFAGETEFHERDSSWTAQDNKHTKRDSVAILECKGTRLIEQNQVILKRSIMLRIIQCDKNNSAAEN